ncbi:hypothetical protein [Paludisphaera soli]|uniref:hypothetical protein n=1 Tax=Paludisphaera soli TaxID=2712865 RepID=UPI0013EC4CF4|nr:hypothetical protein [Paludisphaera soli]
MAALCRYPRDFLMPREGIEPPAHSASVAYHFAARSGHRLWTSTRGFRADKASEQMAAEAARAEKAAARAEKAVEAALAKEVAKAAKAAASSPPPKSVKGRPRQVQDFGC